jgi:hypothetical protein
MIRLGETNTMIKLRKIKTNTLLKERVEIFDRNYQKIPISRIESAGKRGTLTYIRIKDLTDDVMNLLESEIICNGRLLEEIQEIKESNEDTIILFKYLDNLFVYEYPVEELYDWGCITTAKAIRNINKLLDDSSIPAKICWKKIVENDDTTTISVYNKNRKKINIFDEDIDNMHKEIKFIKFSRVSIEDLDGDLENFNLLVIYLTGRQAATNINLIRHKLSKKIISDVTFENDVRCDLDNKDLVLVNNWMMLKEIKESLIESLKDLNYKLRMVECIIDRLTD